VQQTPLNIIASFLKQLASRLDTTPEAIRDLHTTFRRKQPELADFMNTLITVSRLFSSTFIILDALNECENSQRGILLNAIVKLSAANMKTFTTCRPHLRDASRCFKEAPTIEIRANTLDIQNYLKIRLDERMFQYDGLKSKIIDTVSLSAQGVCVTFKILG